MVKEAIISAHFPGHSLVNDCDTSYFESVTLLKQLPALAILEWIDVPVLAFDRNGTIVFANWAFADMIGYTPKVVQRLPYRQIFDPMAEGTSAIDAMKANADLVIRLAHLDGSVVQARVGEALLVGDDELALITFDDMTEQLWLGAQ